MRRRCASAPRMPNRTNWNLVPNQLIRITCDFVPKFMSGFCRRESVTHFDIIQRNNAIKQKASLFLLSLKYTMIHINA